MEPHKPPFFDEEAAVDDLAKGYFWDKTLIDKRLFEIVEDEQKGQKWGKKTLKRDRQKNFHFGNFGVKKWENHPFLRIQWRRGDGGYGVSVGIGRAVREGFTAFHPRGTRLTACLKMAGDPPAAQIGKDASARGFKDNNDHKDIKDAREGI